MAESKDVRPTELTTDGKHALYTGWTYWELRAKDVKQGVDQWRVGSMLLPICTFRTVEDFVRLWHHVPNIGEVFDRGEEYPSKRVQRDEADDRGRMRTVTTKAEGYFIFREGIPPSTEYAIDGVRATQNRRRAELSVRARDIDTWWRAWQSVVMALVGETIDPDKYIVGAALNDKKSGKGIVALRLELWFSCKEDDICDAIAGELGRLLSEQVPDMPFRFQTPQYDKRKQQEAGAPPTPTVSAGGDSRAPPDAGFGGDRRGEGGFGDRRGGGAGGWASRGGDRDRGERRDYGGAGGGWGRR